MKQEFKIQVPDGCSAKIEQQEGFLVVVFEQNKEEKWVPKDGDFIAYSFNRPNLNIGIFREQCAPSPYGYNLHKDYITIGGDTGELLWGYETFTHDYMRPATDAEKQRLFDALAKKGKRWNAETKQIEDLPRWRAKDGETYYIVTSFCEVSPRRERDTKYDIDYYDIGNYFRTEEAASRAAEKIRKILKEAEAE